MSADRRCPILEVDEEPQFDAWVGDCDLDLVAAGLVDRCRDIGVLVDIEHAPVLVRRPGCRAALSPPGRGLPLLPGCGPVDERCGHAVEVVHDHAHACPMFPVPVVDVVDFRFASFGENDDHRQVVGLTRRPFSAWDSTQPTSVATSSAALSNPPEMRIGVAPYQPSR